MDFKIKTYHEEDSRILFKSAKISLKGVKYKGRFFYSNEIGKHQLIILINELNKENNQLKRDVEDLNLEMTLLKDEISEMKWQLDLD